MTDLAFNKSIVQMGTGKVGGGGSSSLSSYLATPDILTEVNHFQVDFFISRNFIPIYKISWNFLPIYKYTRTASYRFTKKFRFFSRVIFYL